MYTNFISKYAKLAIYEKPDKEGNAEKIAQFMPVAGKKGQFSTNDQEVVDKLLKHTSHGKTFSILKDKMPKFEDESIIKGAVTSLNTQQIEAQKKNLEAEYQIKLDQAKQDFGKKYMRYGELKTALLNKEGNYRKDATEELKAEYEQLKNELGE